MPKNKKQKEQIINNAVNSLNKPLNKIVLSKSLQTNITNFKQLFVDDDVFLIRELENNYDKTLHYALAYCNGLINLDIVNKSIIKPLMTSKFINEGDDLIDSLKKNIIQIDDVKRVNNIKEIVVNVTYGDVILFVDGFDEVLILNAKLLEKRAIAEPQSEKILLGPREGFTEALLTNLSLIRRKLRTNQLKFKYLSMGEKTNTKICICYIDSIVNKDVLDTIYKRISKIKIDGVLDTNYITELTKENRLSPFRTTGYSERPDVIVGKLLEGRVAILMDGTPVVLTIPYLFVENFQSSEDYYFTYFYSSFSRMLRILGFFLTITIPAFYIALVAFHREMLPTPLFINVAIERHTAPLPAAIEGFLLLIVFDILKETGSRMPTNIGEALSIVGVIVIGQAAVDAELVAAPMIIVVAFTGITSLLVPKLNSPIIFSRFLLLFLASTLGFFGFMIGLSLILVHVLNLRSFNVHQVAIDGNFKKQNNKDTFFRSPLWMMKQRPGRTSNNQTRMAQTGVKYNDKSTD